MEKDVYEFKMVPKMPSEHFTKVTYRGFVMPLNRGKWYYGQTDNGKLCVTNGWEVNGLTQVFTQHEKGGKYTYKWLPVWDDDGTQLLRISEHDLIRIKTDLQDHLNHAMEFDDWLLSNQYEYGDHGNLDFLAVEETNQILDDYDYYLYNGNKYPYFVRKIVEKELEKKDDEVENMNELRSYKTYNSISLGSSDNAILTLTGNKNGKPTSDILNFVIDGDYNAYLVDEYAEIGNHYNLVLEFDDFVKVYDDFKLMENLKADHIKVYRAGDFGCIIQLIGKR